MINYNKIFYVDLDVIFLNNSDSIFELKYNNFNIFYGTYDWGRWSPIGTKKMNGGVFLFQPSLITYKYLLKSKENIKKYKHNEAEQGLFNWLFIKSGCCLPVAYNTQKSISVYIPSLWNKVCMKIIYY